MRKGTGFTVGMGVFCGVLLATFPVLSAPAFTAEAVHILPGQSPEAGRVFISEQGSRFEFKRKGQSVVQIVLPQQGIMRLLFPRDKTYLEMTQSPQPTTNRSMTPCPPSAMAQCEQAGAETLSGRTAEVWRITFNPIPGQESSPRAAGFLQIWWDAERKLALREQYPDGRSSTTVLRGRVNHQGRSVERWQVTLTGSEGKTLQMERWYDPELQTEVREEYPNGTVREFRDIRLVTPDPGWFTVPVDYRQINPQAIQGNGSGGALTVPRQPGEAYTPNGTMGDYPPTER